MQTAMIAAFQDGTERDSSANKAVVPDHYLTTPIMRRRGIEEVPAEQFRSWLKQGLDKYTYFARGKWTGRIKIGSSNDPWRRVGELIRSNNGEEAELLVVLRGDFFEMIYHREFERHLNGYEWFSPHSDILDEIERLKGLAS